MRYSDATQELQYFCGGRTPHGQVLLINGDWGAGKTFLWRSFSRSRSLRAVYVSAFGLESLEDLQRRLLSAVLHESGPELRREFIANVRSELSLIGSKALASWISSRIGISYLLPRISLFEFLPQESILVIDDLERKKASFSWSELLGAIYSLTLEKQRKVILIGNTMAPSTEDADGAAWQEFHNHAEKVLNATIYLEPDPARVFDSYNNRNISPHGRQSLSTAKKRVLHLMQANDISNLRLLERFCAKTIRVADMIEATLPESVTHYLFAIQCNEVAIRANPQKFAALNPAVLLFEEYEVRKKKAEVPVDKGSAAAAPAYSDSSQFILDYWKMHGYRYEGFPSLIPFLIDGVADRDSVRSEVLPITGLRSPARRIADAVKGGISSMDDQELQELSAQALALLGGERELSLASAFNCATFFLYAKEIFGMAVSTEEAQVIRRAVRSTIQSIEDETVVDTLLYSAESKTLHPLRDSLIELKRELPAALLKKSVEALKRAFRQGDEALGALVDEDYRVWDAMLTEEILDSLIQFRPHWRDRIELYTALVNRLVQRAGVDNAKEAKARLKAHLAARQEAAEVGATEKYRIRTFLTKLDG